MVKKLTKKEPKGEKREGNIVVIWVIVGIVILFLAVGGAFFILRRNGEDSNSEGSSSNSSYDQSIETYFDSSKKQGKITHVTFTLDKKEEGEFWVDGRKFRIEYTQEDGTKRRIISPDGELAYFCYEDEEICKPSVVSVDNYMLRWNRPSDEVKDEGMDEEFDCKKLRYDVDETFDMEGASNAYYVKDILYCVGTDGIKYRESRGNSVLENGIEGGASHSRTILDEMEYGGDFKDSLFELPYDIVGRN
jgi:hypothetical protein